MNFGNENFKQNNESDAIERFIRILISRNELSLARNIIGSLGENYNHLLFELEVQSGNYKKALEIFNYLPKEKQQMYIHIVDTIEKDAEKVSEAFGNLIKNLQSENFPIFIAEIQKLKKDYPQVVEVVALELISAVKRGDKKKIKLLSEILEQIDKTHPALSHVKRGKNFGNIFVPAILIALFVIVLSNLIISIFSLSASDIATFSNLNKEIANIAKSIESLTGKTEYNNDQLNSLSQSIEGLKGILENINKLVSENENKDSTQFASDDLSIEKINKALEEVRKSLQSVVSRINSVDKKVSAIEPSKDIQINKDDEKINKLLGDVLEIKKTINNLSQQIATLESKQSNSIYNSKIDELIISVDQINSQIKDLKLALEKNNVSVKSSNFDEAIQKLVERIDNMQKEIATLTKTDFKKLDKLDGLSEINNTLNFVSQQLNDMKNLINKNIQSSTQVSDSVKSTNDSSQDIANIKIKLNTLEQKVEEIKNLISILNVPERQNIEPINNELSSLKESVSNLGKIVDELKNTLKNINDQILELKNNATENNKSAKVDTTVQQNSEMSDVQKILKETKDLYELYVIGIRYYSNRLYKEALYILNYVENQIDGLDVYFKEDTYYYQIMSYLKLGDKQNAQKKFQEYKKLFPSGNYIKELEALF